jgi:hypothetical protein
MDLKKVREVVNDPTSSVLAALGLPRICPRLDHAVGTVLLHHYVGFPDPVWEGEDEEELAVQFPLQDEHDRAVIYVRHADGSITSAVVATNLETGKMDLRVVRNDEEWGQAIWPHPF